MVSQLKELRMLLNLEVGFNYITYKSTLGAFFCLNIETICQNIKN